MAEKIDPTLVAYAFDAPAGIERVEAGLDRVGDHYRAVVDYPLARRGRLGQRCGAAVIGDAEPLCAWPTWSEADALGMATAYVPTGWERLIGEASASEAAIPLARAIAARPERAAEQLNAPFALAIADADRLLVLNDMIGAGRLYEMRTPEGWVWSNRVGALPLFGGVAPEPDPEGWAILAAAGWFFREVTPIAGARKVRPGVVIEFDGSEVRRSETDAIGSVLGGAGALEDVYDEIARQATSQVRTAEALWPDHPTIDLSGGRDSRLVAAAAVSARVEATFRTTDVTPGEADVARQLADLAPWRINHKVSRTEERQAPTRDLVDRALSIHLLHDGMRHPAKMRGDFRLPRPRPSSASLSGHGGEIAHGFYYVNRRQLRAVKRGDAALLRRLEKTARGRHSAAGDEVYGIAREAFERTLDEGRDHGLEGPSLLDFFYMMERFAHRSGVAAHAERVSVFATPAFIRGSFAITPKQRFDSLLHREVIGRLVPEWRDVDFFKGESSAMPRIRRLRMWEVDADRSRMEEILADPEPWQDLFEPRRVRRMWKKVVGGGGEAPFESIFERIVYRVAFDRYLEQLAAAAAREPSPA